MAVKDATVQTNEAGSNVKPVVVKPSVVPAGSVRNRKDADAWLNLKIKDANGIEHPIQATIPLYVENRVHRALMNKCASPDAFVEITASVKMVDKDAPEIEL